MHHLGRSKVTKLSAKAGVVYPLIRLPKSYADQIGKVAEIFETQHDNRRALLVTFDDEVKDAESEIAQPDSKVIQLLPKVIQPDSPNGVESRLSSLEFEISELKSLIFQCGSESDAENRK
jgi:hypothetical protein